MIKAIDLFCGCGGLSLGFQQAGFEIVGAFDNWKKAVEIYNENFQHKAELKDVYELTADYLKKFSAEIIIGGPPCQDYSSAGKRNEKNNADLTIRFAELVCEVNPKFFLMENVDRIIKSETLKKAVELFRRKNYGLTKIILDASLCNVPQKRKRFFLIGELNGKDDFLKNILLNNLSEKSITIRDYLGEEFGTNFYYRHPRSYARRGVFSIDEPSPTIRGVNRPIPANYKIHSGDVTKNLSEVRPLTTLERARLQTFPKNFKFSGTKTELEQIIGNAVPVELSKFVGKNLANYIRK